MKSVKRFFIKSIRRVCRSGGYGIHSPFAFDFVTNVVYNPLPYYFFTGAAKALPFTVSEKQRKMGELLFRIVEHYKLSAVVTPREQYTVLTAYAAAPSSAIKLYDIKSVKPFPLPALFLFDNNTTKEEWEEFYKEIKDSMPEGSVVAITDIQENREKNALWNELYLDLTASALFDLYDIGIVFLQKGLHKKRYIVSY